MSTAFPCKQNVDIDTVGLVCYLGPPSTVDPRPVPYLSGQRRNLGRYTYLEGLMEKERLVGWGRSVPTSHRQSLADAA